MTTKTFFSELEKLVLVEPKPQAHILFSENCEQGEHIYYSKNLILDLGHLVSQRF